MRIELINTGTELLIGSVENTHVSWFARELFKLGLRIARQTTVPDGEEIRGAICEAISRADVLIITGGLGPTSDDLTREFTAEAMGLELCINEAAKRSIEGYFSLRNRPMAESNLKQAFVPKGGEVLPNSNGTAPGVYIPKGAKAGGNCAIFLLPGPPRELYPMALTEVFPRLRNLSGEENLPSFLVLKFVGIGEGDFHQKVDAQLSEIKGLEYGYCARIGEVDLRLVGFPEAIGAGRKIALDVFSDCLVSDDGASLEEVIVRLFAEKKMKLTTAESCTGGLIANRLTDVSGASEIFTHGFVTYSNQAKVRLLGVSEEALEKYGAVSETVACQMAAGALQSAGADIAVSVTGIAGPTGGSDEKPVGTAWIGIAKRGENAMAFKVFHPRNRHDFKLAVSQAALDAVRKKVIS